MDMNVGHHSLWAVHTHKTIARRYVHNHTHTIRELLCSSTHLRDRLDSMSGVTGGRACPITRTRAGIAPLASTNKWRQPRVSSIVRRAAAAAQWHDSCSNIATSASGMPESSMGPTKWLSHVRKLSWKPTTRIRSDHSPSHIRRECGRFQIKSAHLRYSHSLGNMCRHAEKHVASVLEGGDRPRESSTAHLM
jgi:hypothetical protein